MLTNEQLRTLENLAVAYDEWLIVERGVPEASPWLYWKKVGPREYLYQQTVRTGPQSSLGPRGADTESLYAEYQARLERRREALARAKGVAGRIDEIGRVYRSLRLPLLDPVAGEILRRADVAALLGNALLVIGTNAMGAYELEAQERFATGLDATEDFDLTWAAEPRMALALGSSRTPVLDLLKEVDDTFTVNAERSFQVRNAKAYEVDILCAPSVVSGYPSTERIRPSELPEQEWLLKGKPVSQVLCDRSGRAARIVAPDPRWMALHKLWLAGKPGRNARKVAKDRGQGLALLDAIRTRMPHYPIDAAFTEALPPELRQYL